MLNRRSFVGCLAGLPIVGSLAQSKAKKVVIQASNRPEMEGFQKLTEEEFLELRQIPRGKAYPPIMDIPVERWPL